MDINEIQRRLAAKKVVLNNSPADRLIPAAQPKTTPQQIRSSFAPRPAPLNNSVAQPSVTVASNIPRRPKMDTSSQAHTATKGLFAHIQTNNAKSLMMVALYVVLIGLMQIALTSVMLPKLPFESKAYNLANFAPDAALFDSNSSKLTANHPRVFSAEKAKEMGKTKSSETAGLIASFHQYGRDLVQATSFQNPISYLFFVVGLAYIAWGIIFEGIFAKRQRGARRVTRDESLRFHRTVKKLTQSRGLPMPAIEVVDSTAYNAYAKGMHPTKSVIGVTSGLLHALNDLELEAVLAHEIAHVEGRDNRLMTIANVCTGLVTYNGDRLATAVREHPKYSIALIVMFLFMAPFVRVVVLVGIFGLAYLLAKLLRVAISRKREFIADARAIEIMKSPAALISALRKVSQNDRVEEIDASVQAMMISNLSGAGLATHPPIDDRIRAIEETTTVNNTDFLAVRRMKSPLQAESEFVGGHSATSGSRFGKKSNINAPLKHTNFEGPELENGNLEGIYQGIKAVDKVFDGTGKALFRGFKYIHIALIIAPILIFVLFLGGSAILGLVSSPILMILVLGFGLRKWMRKT